MRTAIAIVIIVFAAPLFAQVDPDPDGIGVYLDLEATQNCGVTQMGVIFDVYVCLTRPSSSSGVLGVMFRNEEALSPQTLMLGYTYFGGAIDFDSSPDHFLLFPEPQFGDVVPLLGIRILSFDLEEDRFWIKPHSGTGAAIYAGSESIELPLYPATGDFELPTLILDGECGVVANEDRSWSEVKTLFR